MAWAIAPHTADLILEATAPTAGDALAEAAVALSSVIGGREDPRAAPSSTEESFFVEAPDREALAVAFLSELVWLADSKDILWTGGGVHLTTTAEGLERADVQANFTQHRPQVDGRGVEVKAVTYHDLVFAQLEGLWTLKVLLDI